MRHGNLLAPLQESQKKSGLQPRLLGEWRCLYLSVHPYKWLVLWTHRENHYMSEMTYTQWATSNREEHFAAGPRAFVGVRNGHNVVTWWSQRAFAIAPIPRNPLRRLARPTGWASFQSACRRPSASSVRTQRFALQGSNLRADENRQGPHKGALTIFGAPDRIRTCDPCLRRARSDLGVNRRRS